MQVMRLLVVLVSCILAVLVLVFIYTRNRERPEQASDDDTLSTPDEVLDADALESREHTASSAPIQIGDAVTKIHNRGAARFVDSTTALRPPQRNNVTSATSIAATGTTAVRPLTRGDVATATSMAAAGTARHVDPATGTTSVRPLTRSDVATATNMAAAGTAMYVNTTAVRTPTRGAVETFRCGLQNMGNTCYLASALQCLRCIPVVDEHFTNLPDDKLFINPKTKESQRELVRAVKELFENMKTGVTCPQSPSLVKRFLGEVDKEYNNFDQHDANQAFITILETIHEVMNQGATSATLIEVSDPKTATMSELARVEWSNHRSVNKSFIVDSFRWMQFHKVVCPTCGNKPHYTLEIGPIQVHLALPRNSKQSVYLKDLLRSYLQPHTYGAGEYFCSRCNQYSKSTVQYGFWDLSEILMFHLDRIYTEGNTRFKASTPISAPDTLNMQSFVDTSNVSLRSLEYQLIGIINWMGGLTGGHYTATVKTPTKQWFTFNDASVQSVASPTIGENTFILIYQRA